MVAPFIAGLGVAGAAMAAKYGIQAFQTAKSNPEVMRQMGAAAAGFRGMGNAFPSISSMLRGNVKGGFEAKMTRGEAAQILGISERSSKQQIKEAHRKIMMLNHPDRGGSPFVASKINEAAECLNGAGKASGSAFS